MLIKIAFDINFSNNAIANRVRGVAPPTNYKGMNMDLIKMNNVNTVNLTDEYLKSTLQSGQNQGDMAVLEDWEMVMVGGGDGMVCW